MHRGSLLSIALLAIACSTRMLAQSPAPQPAEPPPYEAPLTNAEIVKLTTAELGSGPIVAKIKQASSESLDVSIDALIALKQKKVSSEIIQAMVERVAKRGMTNPGQATPTIEPASTPRGVQVASASPSEETAKGGGELSIGAVADIFCQEATGAGNAAEYDNGERSGLRKQYTISTSECKVENGTVRIIRVSDQKLDMIDYRGSYHNSHFVSTITAPLAALEWPVSRDVKERRFLGLEIRCADGKACINESYTQEESCAKDLRPCSSGLQTSSLTIARYDILYFSDDDDFAKAAKALSILVELSGGKKNAAALLFGER